MTKESDAQKHQHIHICTDYASADAAVTAKYKITLLQEIKGIRVIRDRITASFRFDADGGTPEMDAAIILRDQLAE